MFADKPAQHGEHAFDGFVQVKYFWRYSLFACEGQKLVGKHTCAFSCFAYLGERFVQGLAG
jgi:hypothetical protein